jgi:phenylalanyl-tRNA synthetase alpha chain
MIKFVLSLIFNLLLIINDVKAVSVFPQCINDISFWLPKDHVDNFSSNDFYDLVRDVGGNLVEQVKLYDQFYNKKTGRYSHSYRIVYRSMERTLSQSEVNEINNEIIRKATQLLKIEIR